MTDFEIDKFKQRQNYLVRRNRNYALGLTAHGVPRRRNYVTGLTPEQVKERRKIRTRNRMRIRNGSKLPQDPMPYDNHYCLV